MSASTTPTFWPEAASAAARFTVTDDLPTPPLPLATAYTRVSEDGWANGICGSACPPRSWVCSARRCSSLITSSWTRTEDTPGSLPTAAVTSRVIFSRSGHPPVGRHVDVLDHAELGDRPVDRGVLHAVERLGNLLGAGRVHGRGVHGFMVRRRPPRQPSPARQARPPRAAPRNGGGCDRGYGRSLRGALGVTS